MSLAASVDETATGRPGAGTGTDPALGTGAPPELLDAGIFVADMTSWSSLEAGQKRSPFQTNCNPAMPQGGNVAFEDAKMQISAIDMCAA